MAIILTGFAIAAILWGAIVLQRCGVLGVGLFTLIAGVCFGAPFLTRAGLTSDRLMVVALFGFYLFAQQTGHFNRKAVSSIDWLGLVFLLWVLGSALSHDWSLDSAQPLKSFMFYYALPAVMYWIARETPMSEKQVVRMFVGLAIFGVYLGLTAVAEWRDVHSVVFPRYIVSVEHSEFLGRGRGPLLNPAGNGILLCLCMAGTALCWPFSGQVGKHLVPVAFAIVCIGLFATLTRCVWVSCAVGMLALLFTLVPYRFRLPILGASTVLVLCVLVANKERLNHFKRDKNVTAAEMSKSASLRPMLANVAWEIFQDQPFTGVGLGQYKEMAPFYHSRETDFARPYIQHNILLSLLTETGLVGVLLLINLLAAWTRAAWLLWKSKTAALPMRHLGVLLAVTLLAYLVVGMFQDVTIIPMVHMVVCYFAGLVVGQYLLQTSPVTTQQKGYSSFRHVPVG